MTTRLIRITINDAHDRINDMDDYLIERANEIGLQGQMVGSTIVEILDPDGESDDTDTNLYLRVFKRKVTR